MKKSVFNAGRQRLPATPVLAPVPSDIRLPGEGPGSLAEVSPALAEEGGAPRTTSEEGSALVKPRDAAAPPGEPSPPRSDRPPARHKPPPRARPPARRAAAASSPQRAARRARFRPRRRPRGARAPSLRL